MLGTALLRSRTPVLSVGSRSSDGSSARCGSCREGGEWNNLEMVGLSSGDLPSTLVDESACSATDGINIVTLRKLLGDCWKLEESGLGEWSM